MYFNPRTHVGCDLFDLGRVRLLGTFQSTHPRGVRLGYTLVEVCLGLISIHAPTWGATQSVRRVRTLHVISIHAPTWGATWRTGKRRPDFLHISIHAPTWGATCLSGGVQGVFEISIHAPTWGATRGRQYGEQVFGISIHAPTWGATKTNHRPGRGVQFQSTHPRGVRPGG